ADRSGSLPSIRRIWDHTIPLSAVQRSDLFARELSAGRRAPSRRVLAAKSPAWRGGTAEQRCRWVRRRDPRGETAALVSVVPHPAGVDAPTPVLRRIVRTRASRLSPLHDLLAGWGRSSVVVWTLLLVPLVGTGKLDDLGVRDADDVEVAVKVEYLGIHRDLALALRLRFDGRGPV